MERKKGKCSTIRENSRLIKKRYYHFTSTFLLLYHKCYSLYNKTKQHFYQDSNPRERGGSELVLNPSNLESNIRRNTLSEHSRADLNRLASILDR